MIEITFKSKSVGLRTIRVRRAVFVTGTSSKATIGFPQKGFSSTLVGSRGAEFFRAFRMCGGVSATYH